MKPLPPNASKSPSSGLTLGRFLPDPKLKLREQLAEVCRYRHMSHRSESAYWHWIKGFIQFHRKPSTPQLQRLGTPSPPAPLTIRLGEGGVGAVEAEREVGDGSHGVTTPANVVSTPLPHPFFMSRSYRRKVLDCASPLALSTTHHFHSARGLAQSRTLTRHSFVGPGSG